MKMVLKLNRMLVAGILSFICSAMSAQENPTKMVKDFFSIARTAQDLSDVKKELKVSQSAYGTGLKELQRIIKNAGSLKDENYLLTKAYLGSVSVQISENTDLVVSLSDNLIQSIIGINTEDFRTTIYFRRE